MRVHYSKRGMALFQTLHFPTRCHPLGQVRNVVLLRQGSLPAGKISSLRCTNTSLPIWGSVVSSSCMASVVLGRAKLHSNSLKNVRSTLRPVGTPHLFDIFACFQLKLFILLI